MKKNKKCLFRVGDNVRTILNNKNYKGRIVAIDNKNNLYYNIHVQLENRNFTAIRYFNARELWILRDCPEYLKNYETIV